MQPNMTDPFKPTKADWEEMRQWVANQDKDGDTLVTYYGARARNAVMYSGASFTRLSGPEAWGPP